MSRWHALTPVLTGGLIGLASWALPLAAFSGEQQLKPLLLERFDLPAALLVLAGVLKLLLAGLCLETGWRGGLIIPVLTGSAAIGLGLHQLLPGVGDAGLWCGSVVGGSLGTLLPSPLLALALGLALLRGHGAEALLLGLLISQVTRHGRPMEENVRRILRSAIEARQPAGPGTGLGSRIQAHVAKLGGVGRDLPDRSSQPSPGEFRQDGSR